jgi:hypothetical protein
MAQRSSRGILPLNPLHNDYVRPAERGVVRARIDLFDAARCWRLKNEVVTGKAGVFRERLL